MPKKIVKPMTTSELKRKIQDEDTENLSDKTLTKNVATNISYFKKAFESDPDVMFRYFKLDGKKTDAALIMVDGLVDKKSIQRDIMHPLMEKFPVDENVDILKIIEQHVLSMEDIKEETSIKKLIDGALNGNTILIIDGCDTALKISTQKWDMRPVEEPISEAVVRGPREGFNENLKTNISLVRRRLKSPCLKIEEFKIGRLTNTNVAIAYIKGTADENLLNEVKERIKRIDIDGILESKYIEEFIEDSPMSPFPTVEYTERPDKVVSSLLEGRIAIFTDNTPFVLIVPVVLMKFLQAPEDYYQHYIVSTLVRWIRYMALFVSMYLPSIYVAATTFHQEMIPTTLAISIAAQREGVPFPAIVEALLMEVSFEFLREAGIRLPKTVGQAVSIVGALVIGDASVSAGIVSPAMVIVVATTGIASFITPEYDFEFTVRMLRFAAMLMAGILGFYGLILLTLVLLLHLASLRSFGAPYLNPLTPMHTTDLKDTIVRAPWWAMIQRPFEVNKKNPIREANGMMPDPNNKKGDKP